MTASPCRSPDAADRRASTAPPALELSGVSLWRWDAEVQRERFLLRDVDWTVQAGEQWAVLGSNGAGKSTLISIAAASAHPSSGSAAVLGERLGSVDVRQLRERIGLVEPRTARAISGRLSATEVVLTGTTGSIALQRRRVGEAERIRAAELLDRFGCGALATRSFDSCSQGERQRLLLARALMLRPPLLLLDEPTTGLDLPGREALLAAVASITDEEPEAATVTVTHHVEELPPTTTHALLLRDGVVVAAGPADAVIESAALSTCFGTSVRVDRLDGRWLARAERADRADR
ncbi:MAG: transporter related protein [Conexibacter sp.]|nr:transporter related protein [Conexibacter sp.]